MKTEQEESWSKDDNTNDKKATEPPQSPYEIYRYKL